MALGWSVDLEIRKRARELHHRRRRLLRTHTTAGVYTFIASPEATAPARCWVLAHSGEVGVEIDADECAPTGRSNPRRGREYRQRYFRNHPRGLVGNP